MSHYRIFYAVIAEIEEDVEADSFEEALAKMQDGQGNFINCSPGETLDGTDYIVQNLETNEEWSPNE